MRMDRPGEPLGAAVEAGYEPCLSCHGCRSVCPMQAATGRLTPLKTVRIAALGILDAVLRSKDIWYCRQCNRCATHCPASVRPSALIRRLRDQAVMMGYVDEVTIEGFELLQAKFQRARWHMVACLLRGESLKAADWRCMSEAPVPALADAVTLGESGRLCWNLSACMTCGACTTVCPITQDGRVYDPVLLFRMVNLGQQELLLRSPSIWLCLGCERCTEACSQGIAGHLVIRELQDRSIAGAHAPPDMRDRLGEIDRILFPAMIEEIDRLFSQAPGSAL